MRWLFSRLKHFNRIPGFTLAELLISLAILGVIATFTIPKLLSSQRNESFRSITKEAAAMVSASYQQAKLEGKVNANMVPSELSPYMNYLSVDSTSAMDDTQLMGTYNCNGSSRKCIRLHNGALLQFWDNASFAGTATNNAIWIEVDPDGKVTDGTTNGPGKGVWFAVYYDGRITDWGNMLPNTVSSDGVRNPEPAKTPPWFSW